MDQLSKHEEAAHVTLLSVRLSRDLLQVGDLVCVT